MAITYDSSSKTFYLDGKGVTYAFFINDWDYAEHLYYGKTIGHDDLRYIREMGGLSTAAVVPGEIRPRDIWRRMDSYHVFPSELTFFGSGDYRESAVHVEDSMGVRVSQLLYDSHEILPEKPEISGMPSMRGGETLVVHLHDKYNDFWADLYYTVYDDAGVIARRVVYRNGGKDTLKLRRAYSFAMSLPDQEYDCITLYGAWAKERKIERIPLHHGVVSVDSKRTTSSATLNPFMALAKKGATEEYGEVYGINLVYSSSYVLKAEGVNDGRTLLTGGINDFDFTWKLEAGECLETPEVVIAYSHEGIGGMSRCFHDAYRNHLINPRFNHQPKPLVINNWEGTYFRFNTEKLKAIADGVAGTGIDTFVLDDGWFGQRNDEYAGLGDWVVNTEKLPGGLKPIIDHVHSLGMKFGLWFEPEMVNEDSDLYRAHPDWAVHAADRPQCRARLQLMLDLTRKEVRDHIVEAVNKVLRENEIDYVKWDYNRNITESWSLGRDADRQAEFAHRYVLGVYDLFERIVNANPNVFFEGCAGGGARFDPGVLYYFPQIWTSDDTDAEERTQIQYGTSLVYPLCCMTCHVSTVPNHQTGRTTALKTRTDIAHLGPTGYELDSSSFTDEDRAGIRESVQEFRAMEDLMRTGDLYRMENPMEGNYFSFVVVSKDKSEGFMTAYRRLRPANAEVKFLKVRGLDPEKRYYIPELDQTLQGATIMGVGLPATFSGDFATVKYHFKEK